MAWVRICHGDITKLRVLERNIAVVVVKGGRNIQGIISDPFCREREYLRAKDHWVRDRRRRTSSCVGI